MFAFLPWPHLPIPFVSPFQARNQTQSTCKGYRQTERERERERDAQILSLSWLPISFGVSAAPTKAISPLRDTFTVAISTNCHVELLLQTQFFFLSLSRSFIHFTLPSWVFYHVRPRTDPPLDFKSIRSSLRIFEFFFLWRKIACVLFYLPLI
jgi:hypothetical protein